MSGRVVFSFICIFLFVLIIIAEPPTVLDVEYELKSATLLSSTLEVGVITATVDQDLYRIDSVACAPHDCTTDAIPSCLCDYTHGAPGGCGTSTDPSCVCEYKEEYCAMEWIDFQDGVPQSFTIAANVNYRYFLDECKAVRVSFSNQPTLFFLFFSG
jgi:hypothetical protein